MIPCHSAIGKFPAGASFKYPSLIETTPQDKAQVIDQQLGPLERLFQANLIPGDAVLEAFRNSQEALDITSTVTDEMIDRVRGKYMNDLQAGQADPYGGAMQVAGEAEGGEQPVDEEGNPVQPEVDENGNPIQPGQQEQADGERKLSKAQFETMTKAVPDDVSMKMVLETSDLQNVSPVELRQNLKEREHALKLRNKRKKELEKVIKEFPAEASQDLASDIAATTGIAPEEFEQQVIAMNNKMHPDNPIGQGNEQPQEAQPQQDSFYGDDFSDYRRTAKSGIVPLTTKNPRVALKESFGSG